MAKFSLSPKQALILFVTIATVLIAQAVWWVIFMARLVNEKVQMAIDLGADQDFVDMIHRQEIRRQIMVGSEGVFLLLLVGFGAWLIYRALVRAEELKFHQQNFLMAVTHELKTPLASIKIYLDTLESTKIAPEKKAGIIPRLKDDANRLERLVENVLEAGRFDRSGYDLRLERFNFSKLVEESIEQVARYPSEIPLSIKKQRFHAGIEINGDYAALKRAIEAIFENSLIYTNKETIEIGVDLTHSNKTIRLIITDNGVGISRKDAARIFDRLYRVDAEINHSRPGTGLGLYLCREIIRAHKGKIRARSDGLGQGIEFNIELEANISDEENSAG